MTKHLVILSILAMSLSAQANDHRCEGEMDSSMCEIVCEGAFIEYSVQTGRQLEKVESFRLIGALNEYSAFGYKIEADRGPTTFVTIKFPGGEVLTTDKEIGTYDEGFNLEISPRVEKNDLKAGVGLWLTCKSMFKFLDE